MGWAATSPEEIFHSKGNYACESFELLKCKTLYIYRKKVPIRLTPIVRLLSKNTDPCMAQNRFNILILTRTSWVHRALPYALMLVILPLRV